MPIPEHLRELVYREADYECAYCGHRVIPHLTTHHIVPLAKGGKGEYDNLLALCYNCHNSLMDRRRSPLLETEIEKELRKLKRHLVHRHLTGQGVDQLRFAYDEGRVVANRFAVQPLVDMGLLEYVQPHRMESLDCSGRVHVIEALYQISSRGKRLVERWILPSGDGPSSTGQQTS